MTETGTALEVIFGRCEKTATGCWEYVKGYHLREGYGQLTYEGKQQPTHRIVWQETNGPIPDGMVVCHSCDNPPCCNPEHLWLGTVGDNNRDRESKGRSAANLVPGAGAQAQRNKTHCKHGHEFTEDNTYRDGRGGRRCRACARRAEQTRKPRSGALKVSPQMLEAMWGIAAAQGKDSALEVGHPTKDVLRVDGKTVAWSAKPQSRVSA